MTREEYNVLFHKHGLNRVAFKMLNDCDEEVLGLVNAAVVAEREACAKVCDEVGERDSDTHAWDAAAVIRARGEK